MSNNSTADSWARKVSAPKDYIDSPVDKIAQTLGVDSKNLMKPPYVGMYGKLDLSFLKGMKVPKNSPTYEGTLDGQEMIIKTPKDAMTGG